MRTKSSANLIKTYRLQEVVRVRILADVTDSLF